MSIFRSSIGYGAYGYIPPVQIISFDPASKDRDAEASNTLGIFLQRKAYNAAIRDNNKQAAVEACTKLSEYDCPISRQISFDPGNPPSCTLRPLGIRKANCETKVSAMLKHFSKRVSDAIVAYDEAVKSGKDGGYITKPCISAYTNYNCPATDHCFDEGKEKCGYQEKGGITPEADHKAVVQKIRDGISARNTAVRALRIRNAIMGSIGPIVHGHVQTHLRPVRSRCAIPRCGQHCAHGYQTDSRGCQTCACKPNPFTQYEWVPFQMMGHPCRGQTPGKMCGRQPRRALSVGETWQCCPKIVAKRKPGFLPKPKRNNTAKLIAAAVIGGVIVYFALSK